jgi:hypothetical protein
MLTLLLILSDTDRLLMHRPESSWAPQHSERVVEDGRSPFNSGRCGDFHLLSTCDVVALSVSLKRASTCGAATSAIVTDLGALHARL